MTGRAYLMFHIFQNVIDMFIQLLMSERSKIFVRLQFDSLYVQHISWTILQLQNHITICMNSLV
jgi:hypothetical protein